MNCDEILWGLPGSVWRSLNDNRKSCNQDDDKRQLINSAHSVSNCYNYPLSVEFDISSVKTVFI